MNKYHCNKIGVKWPSSWSETPFWPLKKINKRGAIKVQNPGWYGIIKEVLLSCFGMKRGPGWGVVACNVETQCQNLNCTSVQTTGVVLLAPNFINHLIISYKHYLHQESHISGHLLRWPPLEIHCLIGVKNLGQIIIHANDPSRQITKYGVGAISKVNSNKYDGKFQENSRKIPPFGNMCRIVCHVAQEAWNYIPILYSNSTKVFM